MRPTQKARLLRDTSIDAEPASVTETRTAQFFTLNNLGMMAMCTVCIVLLLYLHIRRPPAPLPAPCPEAVLTADNITCGQSTDCQQGFRDSTNSSCEYHSRPSNTSCRLACAAEGQEGMCDARGECIGNASQCPGTCADNSDCPFDEDFFNEAVIYSFDAETGWDFPSWYNPVGCYFTTCMWGTADIYAISTEYAIKNGTNLTKGWWPGASRFQCTDYISPEILAIHPNCFRTERYLLSPHMIDYSEYGSLAHPDGAYGNGTFPFQISFCTISYKCSRPNPTDEASVSSAVHMRSLAQRGLSLIASSGGVPFGIADPVLRNHMYDKLEEAIHAVLPDFLDRVFANVTFVPSPSPAA
jgi:hypothetical protein